MRYTETKSVDCDYCGRWGLCKLIKITPKGTKMWMCLDLEPCKDRQSATISALVPPTKRIPRTLAEHRAEFYGEGSIDDLIRCEVCEKVFPANDRRPAAFGAIACGSCAQEEHNYYSNLDAAEFLKASKFGLE
jgi:hypothetical protein